MDMLRRLSSTDRVVLFLIAASLILTVGTLYFGRDFWPAFAIVCVVLVILWPIARALAHRRGPA